MRKKEVIWREILIKAREEKKVIFTQKELAESFNFSLSTVFHALKTPRNAHIVEVSGRNARLVSYQKLLYLWATERRLQKEMISAASVDADVKTLESLMPPQAHFGLYSAFSFTYQLTPADYDHVYVYLSSSLLPQLINRLPSPDPKSLAPNLFTLKEDAWLSRYEVMPPEQMFVDIWNAPEWYAKDFLRALEEHLPL